MALVHGRGYGLSREVLACRRARLLGKAWAKRYDRLPNASDSVEVLGESASDDEVAAHRAGAEEAIDADLKVRNGTRR